MKNFSNKFIVVVGGLVIIVIDVLIGISEYRDFSKTYGNKFELFGSVLCLLPYIIVGLVIVTMVIVICKKNYKIIGKKPK